MEPREVTEIKFGDLFFPEHLTPQNGKDCRTDSAAASFAETDKGRSSQNEFVKITELLYR